LKSRGVTLLETVVALAITAVVLAALHGAMLRAADARARATAAADRVAAARTVLLALAGELTATASTRNAGAAEPLQGVEVERSAEPSRPWSALRFTTMARAPVPGAEPASDRHLVGYRVEPDPARPWAGRLVRRVAVRPSPAAPPGVPVLDRVRRFTIRCFDGEAWHDDWPPGRVPHAVSIEVGVERDTGGIESLRATVSLPVAER
jgi:type II secretion system protein J